MSAPRTLVLGGTAFLGRHIVEAAIERGHTVTIFARGHTNPGLYPEVEHIRGDRETDTSALEGRDFELAFDTSGYLPRIVADSANLLAAHVERYVFVSTLSVYEDAAVLTEETPTRQLSDPASEDVTADYGALKAVCENAVATAFPGRAVLVRPGLIVGRYDYTGRFGYWPKRLMRGGEVLAPGRPERRVWLIDARDLAGWMIELASSGASGAYNAAGPEGPLSMGTVLETCTHIAASDATFTWVDDAFLIDHDVVPYTDLPLWVPDQEGGYPFIDLTKAIASGLKFRALGETIRDVLEGDDGFDARTVQAFGWSRPPAGIPAAREQTLLAAWRAAQRHGGRP